MTTTPTTTCPDVPLPPGTETYTQVLAADRPPAGHGHGVEVRAAGVGTPPSRAGRPTSAGTRRSLHAPTSSTPGSWPVTREALLGPPSAPLVTGRTPRRGPDARRAARSTTPLVSG